jgi:hypothetical protein
MKSKHNPLTTETPQSALLPSQLFLILYKTSVYLLGNISMTFVIFRSSVDIPHGPRGKPPFLLTANEDSVLKV